MLVRLTLMLLVLPAMALAADAPSSDAPAPSGKITVIAQPAATPDGSTDETGDDTNSAASAAPAPTTPAPLASAAPTSAPADPAECRMGCAQSYYFCASQDHTENCSPSWSQCVATCDSPDLDTGVSTAP